jgi:hypothetical protein
VLERVRPGFRYAVRGLRLKPWCAVAVILTLGLGVGAKATMFGIVDRLLFRPPRYLVGADRTGGVFILRTFRGKENDNSFFSCEATRLMIVAVSDADLWYVGRDGRVKPWTGAGQRGGRS